LVGLAAFVDAGAARAAIPGVPAALAPAPEGYVAPVLLNQATITYPEELLSEPTPPSGQVVVKFVLGVDGIPKEIEVASSVHPVLDRLASEAVASLRYTPGKIKEQPIEVVMSVGLDIVAPERPAAPAGPTPAGEGEAAGEAEGEAAGEGEASPAIDAESGPVRLSGKILTAGLRSPVDEATILVVPAPPGLEVGRVREIVDESIPPAWSVKTVTGADGTFELRGIPSGKIRIIVLTQGYERLDEVQILGDNDRLELTYYQKQLNFNPYKTVVKSQRDEVGEVNRRTITLQEINALPGTQGDALKSIQNFPGVARAPFGAGLLVIRGSAPGDSAVYLAQHEIPQLFHFGGITSVFNSDILTQIDFIPGNFDSRYGDAIGGIINVAPRKGRTDGFHGYIDSDLFDTGILAETKLGKGSLILSGRRSYIDFVLSKAIPSDAGLNLTVAPRYYDYQVLFDYPISGGDFSARVFGSDDRTSLVFNNQNDMQVDDRNRFDTTIFFHRADLSYTKRIGAWDFMVTPSYRRDFASIALADAARFDVTSDALTGRAELARQLAKRASLRLGTEFVGYFYSFDITAPTFAGDPNTGGTGGQSATTKGDGTLIYPALYTTMAIGIGERLTLFPGARLTIYGKPFYDTTVDPRLRWNLDVTDNTSIKGGVGIYSQAPNPPFKFDKVFGNPRLGPERSVHTSLGVAHQFERDITLEITGFYKYLWDLSAPSSVLSNAGGTLRPELWANTGIGHIFGGELLARKALTRNLFGWLSYTLMRSLRQDAPGEDLYLFDFDQTHILTAIASYKLPHGWQIGARFRLVSGNPTTPVIGAVYDASTNGYIALTGPRNSARVPAFHQLDLRVDRRWVYRRLTTTAYLDVLNIYNAQNTEFINYSYNYQASAPVTSLPILPSIGLKLEW
ncbi:MAG: energy transducer TonB, partial [Myxococcales bacterium]|nr:energy transducer TonB [Myxococcales bacterium]